MREKERERERERKRERKGDRPFLFRSPSERENPPLLSVYKS